MWESREMWVWSLGVQDTLEKGMATHSSILVWRMLWTERNLVGYSPWGCKELDTTAVTAPSTREAQGTGKPEGPSTLAGGPEACVPWGDWAANAKAPTNHFQPLSPVLVLASPTITSSPSHLFLSGHLQQSLPAPLTLFLSWHQSLPSPLTCSCPGTSNNHFQPLSPVLVLASPPVTSSPFSPVLVLASSWLTVSSASGINLFPALPLKPNEHSCTGALAAWLMQAWSMLTASSLVNVCFQSIHLVASFYFPDCLELPVFCHRRTTHPYFPVTRTVSFVQVGENKYK